jgi:anti-sigma regulatory factor (Ser/Thr protein kinase)
MTMIDMTIAGRNPGRIIGGVLTAFAAEHPDKAVQMIGEPIWAERSAVEYPACVQHEALINNTFAGRDLAVLCPYNTAQLPPEWLADARATHPVLWEGSSEAPSDEFAPDSVWAHYNQPLTRSESAVTHRVRNMAGLAEVRSFTNMYGQWFDLPSSVIEDLRLVATELAAGSLRSAGSCTLAIWRDGGHLVCEVRDAGRLDDPLSGRRPYFDETIRGQGLFVVNAVADLVRAHVSPHGTTIQAILRLAAIA